jgi:hypothetical protein
LGLFFFSVRVANRELQKSDFVKVPSSCTSYETCFPALAKAAAEMEALPLNDVKTRLLGEIEKGDVSIPI